MNYEKFLPIGTVCLLKGAKKRVMVTGYLPIPNERQDVMYDYSACVYPEGVLSSDQTMVFNHDQIENVFYLGFVDDEQKQFANNLKIALSKEKVEINANNTIQQDNNQNTASIPVQNQGVQPNQPVSSTQSVQSSNVASVQQDSQTGNQNLFDI